jgi:hypothetical protein
MRANLRICFDGELVPAPSDGAIVLCSAKNCRPLQDPENESIVRLQARPTKTP